MPADFGIIPRSAVNKNRSPIFYRQLCPGELAALLRKSHKQMQTGHLNTGFRDSGKPAFSPMLRAAAGRRFPRMAKRQGSP